MQALKKKQRDTPSAEKFVEITGNNSSLSQVPAHPPQLGQHVSGDWSEVPADILVQVMEWSLRTEKSIKPASSLAYVSKNFHAIFKHFLSGDLVESHFGQLHKDVTAWLRWQLGSLGYRPNSVCPKSREELKEVLRPAPSYYNPAVRATYVWIDNRTRDAFVSDWLNEFKQYEGKMLSIGSFGEVWPNDRMLDIEKSLPTEIFLKVYLGIRESFNDKDRLAEFIARLCEHKRPLAFEFDSYGADLPGELMSNVLLDTMCGQGFVTSVSVNFSDKSNALYFITNLAKRFDQIRHTQFIRISCHGLGIDDEALQCVQSAMKARQLTNGTCVNVAIEGVSIASAEKRKQLEQIGLYFGTVENSMENHDFVQRIAESMGTGPIDFWINRQAVSRAKEDSDSDSIVEVSSDDDSVSFESSEEYDETEPRVKKRGKCVIS
jgi:hypothetical protein